MIFRKRLLAGIPGIYTVNSFAFGGGLRIGAGPEKEGEAVLIDPLDGHVETVAEGPGGMMGIVPVPGRDDMLVSVMGLFPPFKGEGAGIYRHRRKQHGWETAKVIPLPFAHRCEILASRGTNYLFSAAVSEHKSDPADWSRPGKVLLTVLDDPEADQWGTQVVLDGLYRNHGMLKTVSGGRETVYVSGAEGIFAFEAGDGGVRCSNVFDREVSEFAFVDIDGDGRQELATIEPFHGDSINVYRPRGNGGWEKIYDSPLSFGHGLSAGVLGGVPAIAAGNRRGDGALAVFLPSDGGIERVTVEQGTGTTQTQFLSLQGRDYLLAANQAMNEAVLYSIDK